MLPTRLGVKLIRIDSLYIIQDSLEDWEIESTKMADIYSHACFTIACTVSSGDNVDPYSMSPTCGLDPTIAVPANTGAGRIAVRKPIKHWNDIQISERDDCFPLLSRGWVFQERLLSR